jgi:hypothetical protein
MMTIFIIIAVILIIILVNNILKQQTISDLLNKLSMKLLRKQANEEYNAESYIDLPDGTILILPNNTQLVAPPNSRLVETRTDIILQMGTGDLFIVPHGTTISIPHDDGSKTPTPQQVVAGTIHAAEASVSPAAKVASTPTATPVAAATAAPSHFTNKSGFIGSGSYEGMNSCLAGQHMDRKTKTCILNKSKFGNMENFNNDLDDKSPVATLSDDYMNDLVHMGLEHSVFQNHKDYADQRYKVTNTASSLSVRDDDRDIIPWVGLIRPNYNGVNQDFSTARQVPTEADNPNALPKSVTLRWS